MFSIRLHFSTTTKSLDLGTPQYPSGGYGWKFFGDSRVLIMVWALYLKGHCKGYWYRYLKKFVFPHSGQLKPTEHTSFSSSWRRISHLSFLLWETTKDVVLPPLCPFGDGEKITIKSFTHLSIDRPCELTLLTRINNCLPFISWSHLCCFKGEFMVVTVRTQYRSITNRCSLQLVFDLLSRLNFGFTSCDNRLPF